MLTDLLNCFPSAGTALPHCSCHSVQVTNEQVRHRCHMNENLSAWLLIAVSVFAEVVGTVALKYSDGFSKVSPSIAATTCYAIAIWLMSIAMRHLDVGITYAVWAACGTAATALVGTAFFGEQMGAVKALGLILVVGGVVLLNLGNQQ